MQKESEMALFEPEYLSHIYRYFKICIDLSLAKFSMSQLMYIKLSVFFM